ncbi:MAG: hypothetical protein QM778_29180 [Myxococcales bacterium]
MGLRRSFTLLGTMFLLSSAGCGDESESGPLDIGPDSSVGDGDATGDGDGDATGDGDGDTTGNGDGDGDAPGDGDGDTTGNGDGDGDGDATGDGDASGSVFPDVKDFAAKGSFSVTTGPNPAGCTIYRPSTLGEMGRRHPVILWGNGTGTTPVVYDGVLRHWASHGFIAAAANTSNAGTGKEMLACLDYLTQQNGAAGNPYAGKVDLDRVGSSGHSQGGGGAIMAGADSRVDVSAPLQPYISFIPGGGAFNKSSLVNQTGPMFLMSGSADTIAVPAQQQQPVFDAVTVPIFWGTLEGATHTGTAVGNINGYRGPATAWFRLHLMNDQTARSTFYGSSCGLCSDPKWTVKKKNF